MIEDAPINDLAIEAKIALLARKLRLEFLARTFLTPTILPLTSPSYTIRDPHLRGQGAALGQLPFDRDSPFRNSRNSAVAPFF